MVSLKGSAISVCLQGTHSLSAPNDSMHADFIAIKAVTSDSMQGCIAVMFHLQINQTRMTPATAVSVTGNLTACE